MDIRKKLSEIMEREIQPIPEELRDPSHAFYYRRYEDNLIVPMAEQHIVEYKAADGGEMEAKGRRPAKMACLTSSSAMTFNILGNLTATMKAGQPFAAGAYEIAYEKQLCTLNKSSNPANLDAFLSNGDAGEAIFCEMKMMEWLGTPNALKEAYCSRERYFDPAAFDTVFSKLIGALRKSDTPNDKNEYPSIFRQYDAWQMFKHTLAIYNAVSHATKDAVASKTGSMAGVYRKVTLLNVVFEMDAAWMSEENLRSEYLKARDLERREAEEFIRIMLAPENGLVSLFRTECNVDFGIRYLPVADFVALFEKSPETRDALKRYGCR